MIFHFIIQGIFMLTGILSLLAAIGNWEWFFSTRNARSVPYFGNAPRKKVRLFYGSLGILLICLSVYFFIKTREAFL